MVDPAEKTDSPEVIAARLRALVIAQPEVVLEDRDLMKALVAANERAMGANIVDLRGIAMARLEQRLDRLEDTHRSVIAAAYENLAGTTQIHRAVLSILEPATFEDFLAELEGGLQGLLRLDALRLVLESRQSDEDPALAHLGEVLCIAEPGFVAAYMRGPRNGAVRDVVLRQTRPTTDGVYGERADFVRSEAVLRLNLGPGRLPGMLVLGSEDPHHFKPSQGTDLLGFFAGAFERAMRRWLA
ncbi:DUF484 family protein [Frigidibacter sp. MR17.24]|uniref:DUF484 family protein n=1 Tax=Frigidibacter sp. MR17.24 TaxID=3127345 RepID=UPI003012D0CF